MIKTMIKILIADDHAVVRRGLKQILAEEHDMTIFGEARNAQEVLKNVREMNWDIVILDITMPDRSGVDVLKELKNIRPQLPVLVLSMHPEDQYAVRVLKAGAAGYMTKESAPEELVKAVRKVIRGGKYITLSLAEKLASDLESGSEKPLHEALSDREYQVACMIASGKTVKAIAKELYLTIRAIRTYRERILAKMRMKSNAELIRYAIKNQLID
jgi:two-component system, NarL family, invasion response regulator UvrY